jgi:hypothetical protein
MAHKLSKKLKMKNYNELSDDEFKAGQDQIVITLESLWKLFMGGNTCHYDIVFVDELCAVIQKVTLRYLIIALY